MLERILFAIGLPLLLIFGVPALVKNDTPEYYKFLSLLGLLFIVIHYVIRYMRNR